MNRLLDGQETAVALNQLPRWRPTEIPWTLNWVGLTTRTGLPWTPARVTSAVENQQLQDHTHF